MRRALHGLDAKMVHVNAHLLGEGYQQLSMRVRPSIAQERLKRLDDGRVRYELTTPWKDGAQSIVLDPLDLVARVIAMIPPPGFHMVRYHRRPVEPQQFAEFAAVRGTLAPPPPVANPIPPSKAEALASWRSNFNGESAPEPATARRKSWAGCCATSS